MVICPKCNQPSQNDKICSNCWSDLRAKPKPEKSPRDFSRLPMKDIVLYAVILMAFCFFMMYMAKIMAQLNK